LNQKKIKKASQVARKKWGIWKEAGCSWKKQSILLVALKKVTKKNPGMSKFGSGRRVSLK
jgi:hypothetical protein